MIIETKSTSEIRNENQRKDNEKGNTKEQKSTYYSMYFSWLPGV